MILPICVVDVPSGTTPVALELRLEPSEMVLPDTVIAEPPAVNV